MKEGMDAAMNEANPGEHTKARFFSLIASVRATMSSNQQQD